MRRSDPYRKKVISGRRSEVSGELQSFRGNFSLKQFQVLDLIVQKEWPAAEVARALGVGLANMYVTKHPIAAAIKREVKRLEQTVVYQFECASIRATISAIVPR